MPMASDAIRDYAVLLGDDSLILGHRLSEWCSRGPFLEEDLALSNTALDFIGRARMFYSYAAELSGSEVTEDFFAYQRDCRDFRNLLMCELPNGDFAFTMGRQYLLDEFYCLFMAALTGSTDEHLAGIAGKAVKESGYHLRRSREWMLRLGDGTAESHARLQQAFDELWGYTAEFWLVDDLEGLLVADGVAVDVGTLHEEWYQHVAATLADATIEMPVTEWSVSGGRKGVHTEALGHLLSDLQFVQKSYPGLEW